MTAIIASVKATIVVKFMAHIGVSTAIAVDGMVVIAFAGVAVAIICVTVVGMAVVAAVPGTGANEDAMHEVIRAVVAVGGAGIGIIAVVTVGADGGGPNRDSYGSNADANADANLGVRVSSGE